jgi:hypothetical protein
MAQLSSVVHFGMQLGNRGRSYQKPRSLERKAELSRGTGTRVVLLSAVRHRDCDQSAAHERKPGLEKEQHAVVVKHIPN